MNYSAAILKCFLPILLICGTGLAHAQYGNFFFRLKPAAQKGTALYQAAAYEKAIPYLKQALLRPEYQHQANYQLMLAHAYALTGKAKESVQLYQQFDSLPQLEARHLLAYTLGLQAIGKSQEAHALFKVYLGRIGSDAELPADLGKSDLYRTAIRYSVHILNFNSPDHEFAPLNTKEGLLFISDRKTRAMVNRNFSSHATDLDVFKAEQRSNTRFVNIRSLSSAVNSRLHEGPGSLDSAGNLYFSRSERNGLMSLWMAKAAQEQQGWEKAVRLEVPGAGSKLHPAISANGRLLFFVSDKPGGFGGTDIYLTQLQEGGWSEPENAGPAINTAGNEAFPALLDNKLYFSSDGRVGLGRYDIYEAFLSNARVAYVRNMGAPVNSPEDDFGLAWLPDASGGYFSSNRKGGRGGDDLYRLDYHIIQLVGTILDSTNHKPMEGVKLELLSPDGGVQKAVTDKQGAYRFSLFPGENYLISAAARSYRPRTFSYSTMQGKQYGKRYLDVALERKTKIFLLGNVRQPDRKRASQAQVLVFDMAGGTPDTLQANERGSFEVELDAESSYQLLIGCDQWSGLATFKTDSRTDASLSHYLNITLEEARSYQVEARIEGADPDKPLVVWLNNSISPEAALLWPDKDRFSFQAHTLLGYELCVQQGEKKAMLYLGSGWQQSLRKVVLKLQ